MAKSKKKTQTKVGIKEPEAPHVPAEHTPPGKPPKRIKMNMSLANQQRSYQKGSEYQVPHDVPVNTARSWIASGAADEIEV